MSLILHLHIKQIQIAIYMEWKVNKRTFLGSGSTLPQFQYVLKSSIVILGI